MPSDSAGDSATFPSPRSGSEAALPGVARFWSVLSPVSVSVPFSVSDAVSVSEERCLYLRSVAWSSRITVYCSMFDFRRVGESTYKSSRHGGEQYGGGHHGVYCKTMLSHVLSPVIVTVR